MIKLTQEQETQLLWGLHQIADDVERKGFTSDKETNIPNLYSFWGGLEKFAVSNPEEILGAVQRLAKVTPLRTTTPTVYDLRGIRYEGAVRRGTSIITAYKALRLSAPDLTYAGLLDALLESARQPQLSRPSVKILQSALYWFRGRAVIKHGRMLWGRILTVAEVTSQYEYARKCRNQDAIFCPEASTIDKALKVLRLRQEELRAEETRLRNRAIEKHANFGRVGGMSAEDLNKYVFPLYDSAVFSQMGDDFKPLSSLAFGVDPGAVADSMAYATYARIPVARRTPSDKPNESNPGKQAPKELVFAGVDRVPVGPPCPMKLPPLASYAGYGKSILHRPPGGPWTVVNVDYAQQAKIAEDWYRALERACTMNFAVEAVHKECAKLGLIGKPPVLPLSPGTYKIVPLDVAFSPINDSLRVTYGVVTPKTTTPTERLQDQVKMLTEQVKSLEERVKKLENPPLMWNSKVTFHPYSYLGKFTL